MAILEIDALTHSFGGLMAVNGFHTALGEDETVGLIGPNGAGKTTIFNLLCGLYRPDAGEMRFLGARLNGRPPHAISALGIGRTFQNIRLWKELSVLDNLRIAHYSQMGYGLPAALWLGPGVRRAERRVRETALGLLRRFGLEQHAAARPGSLSYGDQRRVEICRALVMRPRLLLLDEPAAGMNQSEIGGLVELIRWVRAEFGVTVWIIEHQMRVIMSICDRIQVVDFGSVIAEGPPAAIRDDPRVIAAYLGVKDEG